MSIPPTTQPVPPTQPFQPTPATPAAQPTQSPLPSSTQPQNPALINAISGIGSSNSPIPTTSTPVPSAPVATSTSPSTSPSTSQGGYTPLTPAQYQAARDAGFSPDDIIANEQKRKQEFATSSNTITSPAQNPGFFSRVGSDLANGSVGQEIIGIGKGIGSTLVGTAKIGSEALGQTVGRLTNLASGRGLNPIVDNQQIAQNIDKAVAPTGGWQQVGNAEEKIGELAAPTDFISGAKDAIEGIGAVKDATGAMESIPAVGKGLSYTTQKVLSAIPEAAFGGLYGLSQGENPKQAAEQGLGFGALSGAGEVVGDAYNAVKGGVVDNINKALGATGKMGVQQALDRIPKAMNAFETMANLASDITVKTPEGVEKAWEPTKDGFYEALQGLQQTKQKVFDAYTDLANQAGGQGVKMTGEDLGKVASKIASEGEDATSAFKSKATSLLNDLKDNFGSYDNKGNFTGFEDTELPRIQKFIQKINTDVNPLSDKAAAEVSDTASKALRGIMDGKIENATTAEGATEGQSGQYQKLRTSYSNLKSIENDMVNQLKKSYRGVGGRVGQYVEGFGSLDTILGILSHNPIEMVKGIGTAGIGKLMNTLRDPEVGLQNAFKQIQDKGGSTIENRMLGGGGPKSVPAAKPPIAK